jgi:hypothetical protein
MWLPPHHMHGGGWLQFSEMWPNFWQLNHFESSRFPQSREFENIHWFNSLFSGTRNSGNFWASFSQDRPSAVNCRKLIILIPSPVRPLQMSSSGGLSGRCLITALMSLQNVSAIEMFSNDRVVGHLWSDNTSPVTCASEVVTVLHQTLDVLLRLQQVCRCS